MLCKTTSSAGEFYYFNREGPTANAAGAGGVVWTVFLSSVVWTVFLSSINFSLLPPSLCTYVFEANMTKY